MNKVIKVILPYLTIIIIVSLFGMVVYTASDKGYSTKDGKASVICDIGFFYDMSKNPDYDTYVELEALAVRECGSAVKERNLQDYRWQSGQYQGKQKHVVLLEKEEICVVNWELTEIGHMVAFNNICGPKESIAMYDD